MQRKAISTQHAPAALGPYSQAIHAGNFVFASGQLGLDPQTGKLQEGIEAQTRQVLANLAAVLAAAGSGVDKVVKTTIFLANMADFAKVNAIYGEIFKTEPPARSTVQVAALPLGGLVEIEVIALTE
ncbi:MAG: Rid family detoxifying hydrolase [Chloroflexi bacterium]|nr:Rid family detoxifying hydrolase [Chloroflexota bacterium]